MGNHGQQRRPAPGEGWPRLVGRWRSGGRPAGLEQSLQGHADFVTGVALLDDGQWAVSCSRDGSLIVWDLARGQAQRALTGHDGPVLALAALPGTGRVLSAGADGTLREWDVGAGCSLREWRGLAGEIHTLAVDPQGRWVVLAAHSPTLELLELASGRLERLTLHTDWVRAVALLEDGRGVSAAADRTLQLWSAVDGRVLRRWQVAESYIGALAALPGGDHLALGCDDCRVRIWDLERGEVVRELAGHGASVRCLATVGPAGAAVLVSAANDGGLIWWAVGEGTARAIVAAHKDPVSRVALSGDGRRAVTASPDGSVRVWRLAALGSSSPPQGHAAEVTALLPTVDHHLASCSEDGTLRIWSSADGQPRGQWAAGMPLLALAPADRPSRLWIAQEDGRLCLWDRESGQPVRWLAGQQGAALGLATTAAGQRGVSASVNWVLKVWELAAGRVERTLAGHRGAVLCVTLLPDGERAVSGGEDGTLRLWELGSGSEVACLRGHSDAVGALALLPDGKRLLSGSDDGRVGLWSLVTGQLLRFFVGHTAWVCGVAALARGRWVLSASEDGTLRLWETASGREVAHLDLEVALTCLAAAGDDRAFFVGDGQGDIHAGTVEEMPGLAGDA